jgi:hypothetical protein
MLGLLGFASTAAADEPTTPPPDAGATASVGERVTVPSKRLFVHAELGLFDVNGGPDAVGLSPDIYYGLNDKVTIGLIHSFSGATGIIGEPRSSLCIAGDGCDKVYNNVGLDLRYTFASGSTTIAGVGGLYAIHLSDPTQFGLKLGAVIHWRSKPDSKLAIDFTPNVLIGLTKRDGAADMMGNVIVAGEKEILYVPATIWYSIGKKLAIAGQLALDLPVEDAGDQYILGLAAGLNYRVNNQFSVDFAVALPFITSGDQIGVSGADVRSFTIGGGYAF